MKIAVAGATGRVGRHTAELLAERGHKVVPIARSAGVDVITGDGLAAALDGVAGIVDAATGPSAEQRPATEFFTTAASNLQRAGEQAGVRRLVVVSIIGTDHFTAGYGAAKMAHEQAALSGGVPARVLRAAQFHEFVPQLVEWGTQGEMSYVPRMRIQPAAARAVGEVLADLVTSQDWAPDPVGGPFAEVAGPREENLPDLAALLVARRGINVKVEGVSDPADPDGDVYTSGSLLPGPHAILGGPTFDEWLAATS